MPSSTCIYFLNQNIAITVWNWIQFAIVYSRLNTDFCKSLFRTPLTFEKDVVLAICMQNFFLFRHIVVFNWNWPIGLILVSLDYHSLSIHLIPNLIPDFHMDRICSDQELKNADGLYRPRSYKSHKTFHNSSFNNWLISSIFMSRIYFIWCLLRILFSLDMDSKVYLTRRTLCDVILKVSSTSKGSPI